MIPSLSVWIALGYIVASAAQKRILAEFLPLGVAHTATWPIGIAYGVTLGQPTLAAEQGTRQYAWLATGIGTTTMPDTDVPDDARAHW